MLCFPIINTAAPIIMIKEPHIVNKLETTIYFSLRGQHPYKDSNIYWFKSVVFLLKTKEKMRF